MTYTEAIEILNKKGDMKVAWGKDLRTVEEDKLTSLYDVPVIVTRYPKEVKAFYMTEDPENPRVVLGFDLLGGYDSDPTYSSDSSDYYDSRNR